MVRFLLIGCLVEAADKKELFKLLLDTGAGYWPERSVFVNCNFPDFFLYNY